MDSGIRAMAEAVGEARRQLRENALPKARDTAREKVPETEEALLLGALAELLEATADLAAAVCERTSTTDSATVYVKAGRRLREQAGHLREDERSVARRTG
ncbi:hypothetical protein [Kitasatospora sp. NPDC101183]|uniref:hypothetical protein n=1 Tax=Kitasatospora sp. NPDC101183 TaxID=3364100 RepID=UPI003816186A